MLLEGSSGVVVGVYGTSYAKPWSKKVDGHDGCIDEACFQGRHEGFHLMCSTCMRRDPFVDSW